MTKIFKAAKNRQFIITLTPFMPILSVIFGLMIRKVCMKGVLA